MNNIILNSFAKLNLYLEVLEKRKDGFHNIQTVFERIDLADKIILSCRKDKQIKIICSNPAVPKNNTNLAYASAKLLQDNFGIKKGLNIKIIKKIPVGAGLGGGSSNAAAVLAGLNKLWQLNLGVDRLSELAAILGSDVPFFIHNTSFASGSGRGEKIMPLKEMSHIKLWHILVVPKIRVLTPLIYRKWDKLIKETGKKKLLRRLTEPISSVKILNLALEKKDISLLSKAMFNSLEIVTCRLYPAVTEVKERLIELGLKAVKMSGSGPAVFGTISSGKEAVSLCRQLKAQSKLWQVFVSKTI